MPVALIARASLVIGYFVAAHVIRRKAERDAIAQVQHWLDQNRPAATPAAV